MSRLSTQLARLNDLYGLDLDTPTATSLLVEGARELTLRAEYLPASLEFGPTVAGQASYAMQAERIFDVAVAGVPFVHLTQEQARDADNGTLSITFAHGSGGYFERFDATGGQFISIYPTPSVSGLPISVNVSFPPPDWSDSVSPLFPQRFDRFCSDYAAWQVYERAEDDPELGAAPQQRFENGVTELRLLRYKRFGRDTLQPQVVGYQV